MTMYISPYRRMAGLREAMNRLVEESLVESAPIEREMTLAVDVQAEDEAFEVTALIPGLSADDINIEILNNTVSIRGEFKTAEKENTKYLVSELPNGKFCRVITLPTVLDPARAEATIQNGILQLRVPKAEAHRPKTIKVTAA